MPQSDSPVTRSIGLSGVLRWLVAVVATIAVGAAFADGQYALGVAGIVVIAGAALLGYQASRARRRAPHAKSSDAGS